ncbi:hypothetical protein IID23_04155 [Patescibacteria group bacterium]|nr:hypothetical protein [Patescibacteria group bacterium]
MFVRLFLFTTGLLSFLYFLFPASFERFDIIKGDVLGIEKRNAQVNKPTIDTMLMAYCINEGSLPKNLNDLYGEYLREERKLDLDKLYIYKVTDEDSCEYTIAPKSSG